MGARLARIEAVSVQIGAVRFEPRLGAAHIRADPLDQPPEPARVIHLNQVSGLMRGQE